MGPGHIGVPGHVEPRSRGQPCGHTVAATRGTPFDRVHTAADGVPIVLTWRCHGGPLHAMVAAVGLDERPVAAWVTRAGRHGQPGPSAQAGSTISQGAGSVTTVQCGATVPYGYRSAPR